jgi:N-methylhydantoinase B
MVSAGGGGYGDPRERNPDAVLEDVREEKVTRDMARDVYGVVVTDDGTVDAAGTEALRGRPVLEAAKLATARIPASASPARGRRT